MVRMKLRLIASGKATRYREGLMQKVVENRLRWKHLTEAQVAAAAGFVAVADKAYLGRTVYVEWPDGTMTGPYLVADCGAEQDQAYLQRIGFAVDLSWELAGLYLERMDRPRKGVRVWLLDEESG